MSIVVQILLVHFKNLFAHNGPGKYALMKLHENITSHDTDV